MHSYKKKNPILEFHIQFLPPSGHDLRKFYSHCYLHEFMWHKGRKFSPNKQVWSHFSQLQKWTLFKLKWVWSAAALCDREQNKHFHSWAGCSRDYIIRANQKRVVFNFLTHSKSVILRTSSHNEKEYHTLPFYSQNNYSDPFWTQGSNDKLKCL